MTSDYTPPTAAGSPSKPEKETTTMNDNTNAFAPERTLADAEAEIAELKETIARVREAVRYGARMDAHPTRFLPANQTVQDSEQWWATWHSNADAAWRQNMRDALGEHA